MSASERELQSPDLMEQKAREYYNSHVQSHVVYAGNLDGKLVTPAELLASFAHEIAEQAAKAICLWCNGAYRSVVPMPELFKGSWVHFSRAHSGNYPCQAMAIWEAFGRKEPPK